MKLSEAIMKERTRNERERSSNKSKLCLHARNFVAPQDLSSFESSFGFLSFFLSPSFIALSRLRLRDSPSHVHELQLILERQTTLDSLNVCLVISFTLSSPRMSQTHSHIFMSGVQDSFRKNTKSYITPSPVDVNEG